MAIYNFSLKGTGALVSESHPIFMVFVIRRAAYLTILREAMGPARNRRSAERLFEKRNTAVEIAQN